MIRLFEMFAGYGGASFALKKAGIEFECVGVSEIDKYAMQCYTQNHKGFHYGDCTKINPHDIPDFDLLTGGFPCQSFSNAGKGLGEQDTRGTLFHEIIRIAEVKKPKYMLLENVKGLTTKKHKATFDKILNELKRIGYIVFDDILNSKNYGIPQNRERVFFVCFRKDVIRQELIKDTFDFDFPEEKELRIFLKDILENEVDDKYYLQLKEQEKLIFKDNISDEGIIKIGDLNGGTWSKRFELCRRVYSKNGVSPTIPTSQGGGITPKIFIPIKNATNKGYLEGYPNDGVNLEHPNSKTRRGRIQKDIIGCLQTNDQRGVITDNFRIRKLTPTECFRLMGFLDDEINLEGLSNTQKYKLAGNGWDINLVSKIFKQMFAHKD